MPDARYNELFRIAAFSHCSAANNVVVVEIKKGRPKGRPSLVIDGAGALFSSLLLRRGQCAGIVNFGNLMVTEAQHLPQDLVGVFAKKR